MSKMSADELTEAMESNDSSLLIVDLRKTEDYETSHIADSIPASLQKTVENDDYADGVETLSAALEDATGSDVGAGKTIVLVCYTGNKYAQAGTDILNALGADMSSVYTLEGGAKGWEEAGLPMTD